jgi:adenylate cyclase
MERKLAAILAADVVGYSALMEMDEAGTFERVTAGRTELFEPEIARHHGRIFKLMGDGLLADFASVVAAVECAVALQRGLAERNAAVPEDKRIQLRIGVNLGEVIVEGDDCYGEGVNIATRIEQMAEPGGIFVSGKVAKEVEKRLALGFEPMGEQKLRNLDEPIQVFRVNMSDAPGRRTRSGSRVSIAVLPFDIFAGEERWQRIADGIVEEIITDLVRHGEIAVIARHSTFAFRGKSIDLREVGRSLGAGYLLVGSMQVSNGHIRLNVQLVDAETGTHLWAARLDRPEGDLFELEDAVVESVAGSICGMEGAVVRAQLARLGRRHPADLESFELYLLALEREKTFDRERTYEAIDLLQRSLALDPEYARAWLILAYCWEHVASCCWQSDVHSAEQERRRAILKAAELDPHDPLVKIELGDILFDDGNHAAALSIYQQALAAGQTNADATALIAKYVGGLMGRPAEARKLMDRALRLNPYAPRWYHMNKLRVCYLARDYIGALETVRSSAETPVTRLFEALSLAGLGRKDDAVPAVAEMGKRYPVFDPRSVARESWINGAEALDQFEDGLRALGFETVGR